MKCQWNIDLTALFKKRVTIETKEGHIITGKLTDIQWQTLNLDGVPVSLPIEVGLDDSWSERVPFAQMVSIAIAKETT